MADNSQENTQPYYSQSRTSDNQPWWLKLFVQVGFPTALAILLVAALLGWMPSPMMQTLSRLEYAAWQNNAIMRVMCNATVPTDRRYQCEPWKAWLEVERGLSETPR